MLESFGSIGPKTVQDKGIFGVEGTITERSEIESDHAGSPLKKAGQEPQRLQGDKHAGNEITHIKYVRDIGLVASTFTGTVKFFDAFHFSTTWETTNKLRKEG